MSELAGRVALVTGASRGIGAATARALAAAGARVILTDLADASALAAELGGLWRRQDVTREDEWREVMAFARSEAGGLDILVNNAGLFLQKPLLETTLDDWRRLHAVNVEGVFLGCKHAVPLLAERAPRWAGGAAIVNISSVAGLVGAAGAVCYNASKGAVRIMTKGLALELARSRIRVNSVHPGLIDTTMGQEVMSRVAAALRVDDEEARSRLARRTPLRTLGKPAYIADAVAFLASDRAAYVTGTEMVVDGGFTAQ
ncbi:MAG: 3-alpha-(or 20-beta)-hydroxysteroid dehydrogenase [Caulobacteraceae bacterium]|nr:3-alpha-(or 20-beta)-hydroxysteroid dehydrogenase [Caulobacteraceae bacterium]